ncbi:MAG: phospho-N-acetylmuramoyl-pentapeptide-transferase [Clostridiales bacterium]|nr:phospho-N-acetylmuramoyl-pentapeptide-transferase [Clostridiales bacterium]
MKLTLAALITSAIIALLAGPLLIPLLRVFKFGQVIRGDGPQGHLKKAGTPTMGGIVFLPAVVISVLLWSEGSPGLWLLLLSFFAFGLIGLWDDLLKVVFRRSLGLKARGKLILQFAAATAVVFAAVNLLGRGTEIIIPISGARLELSWLYYPIMAVFFVFIVNAVNFTDGLDGLAAGVSFLVYLGFMLIALVAVNNPPVMNGGVNYSDAAIGAAAISGACLGFLYFNRHPAKVFMGDTGSLSLGGGLVALSILTKTEAVLLLLGAVYVAEALSVVLQVLSFRLLGRRIFLMSPLHHHFELKGWSETKVAWVFFLAAALSVCAALLLVTY